MDFNRIVTYPMESEEWVKTVLIGGVLVFFGFLLVPLFAAYGYLVRVMRQTLDVEPEPPVFEDWGDLLVEGAKAWAISVVYMLVPLLVAGVTIGGSIVAMATGNEAVAAAGFGGLWIGFLLSGILAIVFGYLAVVGVLNFADTGRFGAAFDAQTIKTVALDREFAVAWLVSIAIFVVASIVSAIPFVGWILTPFATFYAAVVAANLWAGGFSQALEAATATSRRRDEAASI